MTTRKRATLITAGAVGLSSAVPALSSAPEVSVTSTLVSDYVFRGHRLGGASVLPAVEVSAGGLIAGLSSRIPVEGPGRNEPGAELDLYASKGFTPAAAVRLTAGFSVYVFREVAVNSGYRRTLSEPNLALSYTLAGIRFTSSCYYDLSRKGPTFELVADVALALTKLGTELDLAATIGGYRLREATDVGTSSTRIGGGYWSLAAFLPYQITSASKIQIGLTYSAAFDSYIQQAATPRTTHPLSTRRVALKLGYSISF
ncbi:hypothetical protein [Opitutus terrae]|uniref:Outer membrane protein beta-barrel domain-containing protein n=1 Tax=Opitutus terrae (strain DSM 11246 / JCM 15787 / PB90-1) TaxID=452637 RepID=B1ZRM3_OPITP|nr:hypothetical protein [Opitutus terrae]ACB77671.1 hypothetical protein Oter_4400 [Opitutus terrae PB90-1]